MESPQIESKKWLFSTYWLGAWLTLALAIPILLQIGRAPDGLAMGVVIGITLLGWALSFRYKAIAVRLHLLAILVYWLWYSQIPGGLPMRLGLHGVAGQMLLMVFPVATLVADWGIPGAVLTVLVGAIGLYMRWHAMEQFFVGTFILIDSIVFGFIFRRLVVLLGRMQSRLENVALQDALTLLGNRRLFEVEGRSRLDTVHAGGSGALLYIDLRRFKAINDALGHFVGDEVLRCVAQRLREAVSTDELVTRVGGDEFTVLAASRAADEATDLARQLVGRISEPVFVQGRALHVRANIGIALWPSHASDLDSLLRFADAAMYYARSRSIDIAVHQPERVQSERNRYFLEVDLWKALKRQELVPYFQPVLDLRSGEITGAEALVRWHHPERGIIPPAAFIGLAEETQQIADIDRWMLRSAVTQLQKWDAQGWRGWLSVNISARTLGDPDLVEEIERIFARENVAPDRLVLELTESTAMADAELTRRSINDLRALGVSVALDDFGLGYSSLAYLRRLPVDHVKIDRSFTRGIGRYPHDEELIEFITRLAVGWQLKVVVEGIETKEQLRWVTDRGAQYGQGYLISRPVPAEEFFAVIARCSGSFFPEPLKLVQP